VEQGSEADVIRTMFAVASAVFAYVLLFGGVAVAARCAFPQHHEVDEMRVLVAEARSDSLYVQSEILLR
jgi:hypothetical protein